jgi:hypothetical protein
VTFEIKTMSFNPRDCLRIRCPSTDHPFHYECHSEGVRLASLKRILDESKENIPPSWLWEFETRDLALAALYYECNEDIDYSFYAFKLRQFNDLFYQYLSNNIDERLGTV